MSGGQQVSARLLRPLAAAMRSAGVDADALLASAGVPPAVLGDASSWLPLEAAIRAWSAAEAETSQELGLRLASAIDFRFLAGLDGAMHDYVLVHLLATGATLGEGLASLGRYGPITFGALRMVVDAREEATEVRLSSPGPVLPVSLVTFALAFPLRAMVQNARGPLAPRDVFFRHPSPPSAEARALYTSVFGTAPRFGAAADGYSFAAGDLGTPLAAATAGTVQGLRARAEEMLRESAAGAPMADRVRPLLRAGLTRGQLGAEAVARQLSVSVRTLARNLEAEGTSHKQLLDEVRVAAARELLAEGRTMSDISEALGFADTRSFYRAARRWFGVTPGVLRREGGGPSRE
jgi:AraC-like DNA-binding protein